MFISPFIEVKTLMSLMSFAHIKLKCWLFVDALQFGNSADEFSVS